MGRRWLWVGVGGVALVAAAFGTFLGLRDGGDDDLTAPLPSPEPSATSAPAPTPIPVVWQSHENMGMVGLGWRLEPRPASAFPAWDGSNAVIYDTQTAQAMDLGEGGMVAFSPDGEHAAWIRGEWYADALNFPAVRGDAWIVTLATGEQRRIGPAQVVQFVEGGRIALQAPRTPFQDAKWELFDVDSLRRSANQTTEGPQDQQRLTSTGHVLEVTPVAGTELPRGAIGAGKWQLLDPADRHVVMEFEAFTVGDATATELVVARALDGLPTQPFEPVNVQLYLLDVTTGQAKWTGFSRASTPNWNLSANDKYVLWTNDYCSDGGIVEVLLLDRGGLSAGWVGDIDGPRLTAGSDEAWMFLTPSGLIAQGTFGATALIDPVTRRYVSVLPEVALAEGMPFSGWAPVQAGWSKDYRYAAYYFAGGHGGLC